MFLSAIGALALLVATELWSNGSRSVELATLEMTRGRYAGQFWFGGVLNGLVVPALLLVLSLAVDSPGPWPAALAGVAALFGLFAYEDAYVRAGQSVPLSRWSGLASAALRLLPPASCVGLAAASPPRSRHDMPTTEVTSDDPLQPSAARSVARLDRARCQGVADAQGAQLHDRADDLLQLRGGVRIDGVRRQRDR
jgi:hypothetical protein